LAWAAIDEDTEPAIIGRLLIGRMSSVALGQGGDLTPLHRAVALFREAGDPLWLGRALGALGTACVRPDAVDEAERHYRAAEAILRPLGKTRNLGNLLNAMGVARQFAGDPVGAKAYYQESMGLERALATRTGLMTVIANLAELEFAEGRSREAVALAREAFDACRRSHALGPMALLGMNLTGYLIAANELEEARRTGLEALALNCTLGNDYFAVICLEHLALAAASNGSLEQAAMLAGYSDAYYTRHGKRRESNEQVSFDRLIGIMAQGLDRQERSRLQAVGAAWTIEEAVPFARTTQGSVTGN
jgi:tetratricopeptide (TPR) repeat protein